MGAAQAGAPEKLEQRRLREFRRAARAAVDRIDQAAELQRGVVELGGADDRPAFRPRRRGEPRHQRCAVLLDLLRLFAEHPRHFAQHVDESGPAVARRLRKVGAAPDRLGVVGEKHRQRPAALLAEMMQGGHVDLIDVRALLAVDLDVDEELVHHARGVVVLETLVRHHVAPVAGRVADGEEDRLAALLRLSQRFRSPGPPVDRVVLVLEKIGARLAREAVLVVGGGGGLRRGHGHDSREVVGNGVG